MYNTLNDCNQNEYDKNYSNDFENEVHGDVQDDVGEDGDWGDIIDTIDEIDGIDGIGVLDEIGDIADIDEFDEIDDIDENVLIGYDSKFEVGDKVDEAVDENEPVNDDDESDGFVDELENVASDEFDDEEPNDDDEILWKSESLPEFSCNESVCWLSDHRLEVKLELSKVVSNSLNSIRVNQRSDESRTSISSNGGLSGLSSRTGSLSFIL